MPIRLVRIYGDPVLRQKAQPVTEFDDTLRAAFIRETELFLESIIREDRSVVLTLLFDPEHNLEERIIKEQFLL